MSSLALFAAPINNDVNCIVDRIKKTKTNNKTKSTNNNLEKMYKLHDNNNSNNNKNEDDDDDNMGEFNPPPKPISIGVDKTKEKNNLNNETDTKNTYETYTNLPDLSQEHYKQVVNYYDKSTGVTSTNSDLMKKLNYMITLLEEERDIKQKSVTEELILYLFLGIFIIFIIDSFARASKYVR